MEIDVETGFPVVPEGMYWEVESTQQSLNSMAPNRKSTVYIVSLKHKEGRRAGSEALVDYSALPPKKLELNEKNILETAKEVYTLWRHWEKIREKAAAENVAEAKAAVKFLGVYPPKRLS